MMHGKLNHAEAIPTNPDTRRRFKTFTPFDDQVAVHVHWRGSSKGGIVMPDGTEVSDQTPTCTVISCGPTCKQIKEGDELVLPNATRGTVIDHGDSGRVIIFKESALFGGVVLEEYRRDARG